MFMRVTKYRMKPDRIADATAKLETMKDKIMAMPGVVRWVNSVNEDGAGCVVALVESREISEGNANAVAEAWSHFTEYLESPPEAEGYDVVVHWSQDD